MSVTDCPVCHRQGERPPGASATSNSPLEVYVCRTEGCPVRTFHPVTTDVDEPDD
jgi:hypothetical protein